MASIAETEILNKLVPELKSEGYDVYLQPNASILPNILSGYRPDVIALKSGKKLAIEIASRSSGQHEKLTQISELMKNQPEWEFRIIWVEDERVSAELPVVSRVDIAKRLREAIEIAEIGHQHAALLLAWAALEALARAVYRDEFKKPQTPGRLIQVLSQDGYFTPNEADYLRTFVNHRNLIIHGDITHELTVDGVKQFVETIESALLDEAA
jgi:uncharacterized protein YutE (UPF0331/DUF86 family)